MQFTKCEFYGTVPNIPGSQFDTCVFVAVDEELPSPAQCKNCVVIDEAGEETNYGTMPHAVDNGDGTGSLKGKLVGMGF